MSGPAPDRDRIKVLNDQFRQAGPMESQEGQWVVTRGVMAMRPAAIRDAVRAVQLFDQFTADNDPHGEHDFGSFELLGEQLFWKIDYYNQTLDAGSEDPSDAAATCRVLTIMLASEY